MTVIVPDYNLIRVAGGGVVDLPIDLAQYDDQFVLKGVDGLGPPDIDVTISNTPAQGGIFQAKVPQNKQIIMRIGLNPDWVTSTTPRHLRNTLYGLLTGGYTGDSVDVMLLKYDEAGTLLGEAGRITGYISKMEIVPFSKDPQVQVTIECLSPYFEELNLTSVSVAGLSTSNFTIENQGNAPAGFIWDMTVANPINGIQTFTWAGGEKVFSISGGVSWVAGDRIVIDSRPGFRNAYMVHSGVTTSLLGFITTQSEWPMLYSGNTSFVRTGQAFTWNSIQYRKAWWGV